MEIGGLKQLKGIEMGAIFALNYAHEGFAENSAEKLKNLENLKANWSKYHYQDSLIKQGFQKALSIPQKDLRKPKKLSNENILPFITIFNPNNPNIYSNIKSSVNYLKK